MELESGVTATTYTKTGATEGVTYQFKVQARNTVGYSEDSSTVSILAASVPATPSAPVTTLIGSDIGVSWTKPAIMGSEITSYKISLQDSNANWHETSSCNGADATIVTNKSCTIPIRRFGFWMG